jgi:hypothetical protein
MPAYELGRRIKRRSRRYIHCYTDLLQDVASSYAEDF